MRIVIVLPTYNEKDNIRPLIDSLQRQFAVIPHEMSILVADDESPDGTAAAVREAMKEYSNLHLVSGKKAGLGTAYVRGMKYALDALGAEAVMQMDADFSHKVEDVPCLIAVLDEGADFVIGSRYVQGGKIPDNWGFVRVLMSRWGNRCARHIAGLSPVRDCTAGFRVIRASLLRGFNLDELKVQGYAFIVVLLSKAVYAHAIVKEVPVEFVDRARGTSKLGIRDLWEFFLNVWRIRFTRST